MPLLFSGEYIWIDKPHCLKLERQFARLAFAFALANAGSNMAARIAMIAITTNSSISVNAPRLRRGAFTTFLFAGICKLWAGDLVKLSGRQIRIGKGAIGGIVTQPVRRWCPRAGQVGCGLDGVGRTRLHRSPRYGRNLIALRYSGCDGWRRSDDVIRQPRRLNFRGSSETKIGSGQLITLCRNGLASERTRISSNLVAGLKDLNPVGVVRIMILTDGHVKIEVVATRKGGAIGDGIAGLVGIKVNVSECEHRTTMQQGIRTQDIR